MATIAEWINVFGHEDLRDVINEKYESITQDIKVLENAIEFHYGPASKKVFNELMEEKNVPMEDWAMFKVLFDQRIKGPEALLKLLKMEYFNILPVWRALNHVTPKTSEEAFSIKVERARQYPIESMYSGKVRKVGGRVSGKCPFHKDDSPSFFIYTNDNHFHCFGCGVTGDSIDFYMRIHKCSFKEAVDSLA